MAKIEQKNDKGSLPIFTKSMMPEELTSGDRPENRIIYLSGSFNEHEVERVTDDLLYFELQDYKKDIMMIVNSYGGDVYGFLAVHDTMRMCRANIATVCVGKAMSAGFMALISGTKGKRFMTQNSRVMIHSVSSDMYGSLSQLSVELEENKKLQTLLESMIIQYTRINKKMLADFMKKDTYLNSEECLKLGIVDHIVKGPKNLFDNIKI